MDDMNTQTAGHELVVIGNGFDLACGLKSSYADFFSSRLQAVDSMRTLNETEWKKAIDDDRLTVWDFILKLGAGPDWCNVEKAIGNWVLPAKRNTDGAEKENPILDRFLDLLDICPYTDFLRRIDANETVVETMDSEEGICLRDISRYVWHRMAAQPVGSMDRSRFLIFLRAELAILEVQFGDYMRAQSEGNMLYSHTAISLLADIVWNDRSWSKEVQDATSVLSFNYTRPFEFSNKVVNQKNVVNIHGKLGGEIVFGVDGKECMDDLDALPFTKTYRVASIGVDMVSKLYDTASTTSDSKTGTIKFFGHSLGEADYSYFQALFDGVDLYGGETRLVFFYKPWEGKDEEELHAETVRAVTRLLTTYGGTLDNRDHGKNLMHKLLLEGRLEIKKLVKQTVM